MLTIIGLLPASYALNAQATRQLMQLSPHASQAIPLIQRYGDDVIDQALKAATALQQVGPELSEQASRLSSGDAQPDSERRVRAQLHGYIYDVVSQMKHVREVKNASQADKREAGDLLKQMSLPVEYAPLWVRMLSALCLGIGTMIGYKRVVRTLGECLGKQHMTQGQGASAELIGSALIGTAGFTGLPVSTTHIVTSGIAGAMVAGGQGVQGNTLIRIAMTWLITLPVTMVVAAALFYVLGNPCF
jgi:inorganic phosphate transporter, PiT family